MNQFFKNTLVLILFVFIGCKATAQKFSTHAVTKGETLESISAQYQITTSSILRYNKEIRAGQTLRKNTILVIPIEGTVSVIKEDSSTTIAAFSPSTPNNPRTPAAKDLKVDQVEPIGFTSHTVRKNETLFGIADRNHITEEDIKRYNRALYSAQLKKKMVLRIPKYKRVKPSEEASIADDGEYETYIVASKETRWSIAHKYGISVDRMIELNPDLSKSASDIKVGQQLRMPKKAGSSIQNQVTNLYTSYTVPAKMNFYQLEKKFKMKSEDIIALNPEILDRGGLKEGMILRFPEQKIETGEVNTDNYTFYDVKPGQTEFALTRKLGVSYKELQALNPELQNGLKAGMVLKIAKSENVNYEVRNALVLDKFDLLDSINVENKLKLFFILPFRSDKMDAGNSANTRALIKKRNDVKWSLGVYSGALIALDSLAELGISVDVKTFDNQLSKIKTKSILLGEDLSTVNAIIGPLDVPSLQEVAMRASVHQVPVIVPTPAVTNLSMGNVFYSYSSEQVLRKRILDDITSKRKEENIIVIADAANSVAKDSILRRFPNAKIVAVIEEKKNIGIVRDSLAVKLSEDQMNWVFVESGNYKLISSVTSILNSFQGAVIDPELSTKRLKLKMFTTNKNSQFDKDVISGAHLSNLNFTYPSVHREVNSGSFVKRYRKRFGGTPDRLAVRGFDLTYDLVLKLAYKNNLMEAAKFIGETAYTGNKFSYEKDYQSGYFNQASYIMSYEKMRIKEVK